MVIFRIERIEKIRCDPSRLRATYITYMFSYIVMFVFHIYLKVPFGEVLSPPEPADSPCGSGSSDYADPTFTSI